MKSDQTLPDKYGSAFHRHIHQTTRFLREQSCSSGGAAAWSVYKRALRSAQKLNGGLVKARPGRAVDEEVRQENDEVK